MVTPEVDRFRALNQLIDAVRAVEDGTGWDRDQIVRYVEGCLLMNAQDRERRAQRDSGSGSTSGYPG